MRKEEGWAKGQQPYPTKTHTLRKRLQGTILQLGEGVTQAIHRELWRQQPDSGSPDTETTHELQLVAGMCEHCTKTVDQRKQYTRWKSTYINLSLLAVSEVRWTGKGILGEVVTCIRSGRSDNNHHEGAALLINQKFTHTVLQWKPINERLLYVRLNSRWTKVSIVSAYAAQTTQKKQKTASTAPYKQYSMTFQGMMSLRWWEASMQEFCRRRVMGQHAVGDIKRLVSLCYVKENELIIGCSLYSDISRWKHQKPDRTHYNKQQMEAISTGCTIITPDRHR